MSPAQYTSFSDEDTVCWTLISYEFMDNDQFSNLDSLLVQLGPSLAHLTLDKPAKEGKPRGDLAKVLNMLERRKCEVCVQLIGCAIHYF
jgi:hypothetical protein